jgi:hypothetical protein
MSKLFKLKNWLTIEEAAKYLSNAFTELVTESDVLRLALDGRLKLSVNFVNPVVVKLGTPYRKGRCSLRRSCRKKWQEN